MEFSKLLEKLRNAEVREQQERAERTQKYLEIMRTPGAIKPSYECHVLNSMNRFGK
jgi:hypothetical protein